MRLPSLPQALAVMALGLAASLYAARPAQDSARAADALPERFPDIARPALIQVSLDALGDRGWDLEQDWTSKHVVLLSHLGVGDLLRRWAEAEGYQVSAPLTSLGHGGQAQYSIELRQRCRLETETIHAQAREVFAAVERIGGGAYATWMAEATR